ncbi:MAG: M48 family metalloprotease [Lewinellaceae bacterium]|nr:M48 family metalloprotease [Phaeodactylibacter sp.]MCB9349981.1 M48 family metalloprotease [Lewinellaceae bacterium]
MSEDKIFLQKARNLGRTAALITGMLGLMAALGYALFGFSGLAWAGIIGLIGLVGSTQIPSQLIMRMQGARPLSNQEAPELARILRQLSKRAGLSAMPQLYYIPNGLLNAFATGSQQDPAIAITHGLLSRLSLRELSGVLAHELSHIRNKDLQLKLTVNIILRLTRAFYLAGQLLLFIYLPMALMGKPPFSWVVILLLLFAPTLMALMTSAFSRTRELDADLEASRLTGDPEGLALALQKLDYFNESGIFGFLQPKPGANVPKWLRTHPTTEERVGRLRELGPPNN